MLHLKFISLVPRMPRHNLHLIPENYKERNVPQYRQYIAS